MKLKELIEEIDQESKEYQEAFKKYTSERKKLKIRIDYEKDDKKKKELQRNFAKLKDEFYTKWH